MCTGSLDLRTRPLIFGEVLFDAFPDGEEALGGAPFNVAWHLCGFGLDPLLVSRVGRDLRGERVEAALRGWGMDPAGLQHDAVYPTGIVTVTLARGQPGFEILPDRAYDHIASAEALRAVAGTDIALLYHGTLALRAGESYAALRTLRRALPVPVWVDVNLRRGGWDRARVEGLLRHIAWLKLNDAELHELTGGAAGDDAAGLERAALGLGEEYAIENLVLTLGERGAMILAGGRVYRGSPVAAGEVVDTVGAGDAFSAVTLLGHLRGWPLEHTLRRALEFSSYICGIRGAIPHERTPYRTCLARWEAEAHD